MEALLQFPDRFEVIDIAKPDDDWQASKNKKEYSYDYSFITQEALLMVCDKL